MYSGLQKAAAKKKQTYSKPTNFPMDTMKPFAGIRVRSGALAALRY